MRRHRYEDREEEEEEEEEEAMLYHQGIAEVRKHVRKVKTKEKKIYGRTVVVMKEGVDGE